MKFLHLLVIAIALRLPFVFSQDLSADGCNPEKFHLSLSNNYH